MTAETTPSAMQVDPALVRQLAELLDETRLTEIEVQDGDRRIRVVSVRTVAIPGSDHRGVLADLLLPSGG